MPMPEIPGYIIPNQSTLMQCVFWIAFDQVPLYADSEDLRVNNEEFTYPKHSYSVEELRQIEEAKEQLLLMLNSNQITAYGCEGYGHLDEAGHPHTGKTHIPPVHWRVDRYEEDWEYSEWPVGLPENPGYSLIGIATSDLFHLFPHENLEEMLSDCANRDEFVNQQPNKTISGKNSKTKNVAPNTATANLKTHTTEASQIETKDQIAKREKETITKQKEHYRTVERILRQRDNEVDVVEACKLAALELNAKGEKTKTSSVRRNYYREKAVNKYLSK